MSVAPNVPKPPAPGLALNEHDALPAGTRFGEFEIIRALGVGGFGIVYLAQDHSLERPVALKEYMPASLANRGAGAMIAVRASSFAETYAMGLRSFINEARLLARFDHPSLVKVYRFWEDNGTAYMVMPFLPGRTLRDARRMLGAAPDETWIRGVLDPLLDALELLHREGVYHRDVAPDNILLTPEGGPVLLDFGAARRVIGDRSQSLTAILKPSYAPIEQYAETVAMRQGPWTDIYALGAVLHFLLFGVPPAPATARAVQPDAETVGSRTVTGVSPRFMSVVEWMLGVRPRERPQDIAAVRAALDGSEPVPLALRHEVTQPMVAPMTATRPSVPSVPSRPLPPGTAAAAPLRSTPPGTPPPSYVPRRSALEPRAVPAASGGGSGGGLGGSGERDLPTVPAVPAVPAVAPAIARRRRHGWAMFGSLGALAAAACLVWQLGGAAGHPHADVSTWAGQAVAAPLPAHVASSASLVAPAASDATLTPEAASVPSWNAAASVPAAEPTVASSTDAMPAALAADDDASVESALPATTATAPPASLGPTSRSARHAAPARVQRYVTSGPSSALEACADRRFIALGICLDRQCERPRFKGQAFCVRMKEERRRHAGNY